ncbi:GGDEF domain-containing protein [Bacillus suaedae]|uniref:GGDEF domain-containing protein n=1 Tax=Halalkalibacter suaedae TaxID=2822140 RepID=A0A941AQR7_9BACI|nr:GGDEF domain-containing protein [Bacillus suaedae]MBP3951538.1 GGDEF domain-containing protein [Bacillus suaedae]
MRYNWLLWLLAILALIIPIFLRREFPPEAWNLLQVSTLIMIFLYPSWGVFIAMMSITGLIIYTAELLFLHNPVPAAPIALANILSNGFLLCFVVYYRIQNDKSIKKLQNLSYRDPMTNLYNRRYLDNYMVIELQQSNKKFEESSVIICDIDKFKKINDTYGHLYGDHVIKTVALQLEKFIHQDDVLIRLGGEEFLIFLPKSNKNEAYEMAEAIRRQINQSDIYYMDQTIAITMSFGISGFNCTGTIEEVIDNADKALYKAKKEGRNRSYMYDSTISS